MLVRIVAVEMDGLLLLFHQWTGQVDQFSDGEMVRQLVRIQTQAVRDPLVVVHVQILRLRQVDFVSSRTVFHHASHCPALSLTSWTVMFTWTVP